MARGSFFLLIDVAVAVVCQSTFTSTARVLVYCNNLPKAGYEILKPFIHTSIMEAIVVGGQVILSNENEVKKKSIL